MDQGHRLDTIKERMANRDRNAEPQPPAQPQQPAQPAQEPAPPVPAQPAQPQTPPEQPPQPAQPPAQPDPKVQELEERLAENERRLAEALKQSEERQKQNEALLAAAQERVQLPPVEELENMSQGEALKALADAMTARVEQRLQQQEVDLERKVVQPTRETVGELQLDQKRQTAKAAYPAVDMNKYRKPFDEMAREYPGMSAVQVLKAVADPRDLSAAPSTPTTPAPPVQPAGAPMEMGVSGRATASQQEASPANQPTVHDHLQRSHELAQQGDKWGAAEARRQGLKKRLADQGTIGRR
jgi:hypothetical protein